MYILASWGEFLSKLKNREKFEGGLKKPEEFEETSNKSPKKTGKNFDRGGTILLAGQNIYP